MIKMNELITNEIDNDIMLHTKKKHFCIQIDMSFQRNTPSTEYQQLIWIKTWNK